MSDVLINQIVGILALCGFVGIPIVISQQKEIDELKKKITTLQLANKLLTLANKES